jgi:hypothetical protein
MSGERSKAYMVVERLHAFHHYLVYANSAQEAKEIAEAGGGDLMDKGVEAAGWERAKRQPSDDR